VTARMRMATSGLLLVLTVAIGIATNIVTDSFTWTWATALAFLVLGALAVQIYAARLEGGSAQPADDAGSRVRQTVTVSNGTVYNAGRDVVVGVSGWSLALMAIILVAVAGVIFLLAAVAGRPNSEDGNPHDLPSGKWTSSDPRPAQAFSYLQKAQSENNDIDVKFGYRGYVGQVFIASSTQLASVAVIVSRDAADSPDYDPEHVGHLVLSIRRVGGNGLPADVVPLTSADGEQRPDGSIRVLAGQNHKDTVISFAPVHTRPGDRFAFTVRNDEPGAVLSFSLRPQGAPDGKALWDGALVNSNAPAGRDNRAVAGYVCNVPTGC
jgi:hypothetical protein